MPCPSRQWAAETSVPLTAAQLAQRASAPPSAPKTRGPVTRLAERRNGRPGPGYDGQQLGSRSTDLANELKPWKPPRCKALDARGWKNRLPDRARRQQPQQPCGRHTGGAGRIPLGSTTDSASSEPPQRVHTEQSRHARRRSLRVESGSHQVSMHRRLRPTMPMGPLSSVSMSTSAR